MKKDLKEMKITGVIIMMLGLIPIYLVVSYPSGDGFLRLLLSSLGFVILVLGASLLITEKEDLVSHKVESKAVEE